MCLGEILDTCAALTDDLFIMNRIGGILKNSPLVKEIEEKYSGRYGFVPSFSLHNYARFIGTTAFAVYCSLCLYANNKTNVAWPSYGTLAKELGINRRTVIRSIKKLETIGLISRKNKLSKVGTTRWYIVDRKGKLNLCLKE